MSTVFTSFTVCHIVSIMHKMALGILRACEDNKDYHAGVLGMASTLYFGISQAFETMQ
jgi:hypothetical protein